MTDLYRYFVSKQTDIPITPLYYKPNVVGQS